MLKIRRPLGRLIFNMGIAIPGKTVFLIETAPCSLRHLHCLDNVRYCSPHCFHPNDLPSLADGTFPHDEVKLTGHKKLTFGVAKVVLVSTLLFKDSMVNFTHLCQTYYQVYTHHIDNFSGSYLSFPTPSEKISDHFGKFNKNFSICCSVMFITLAS